MVRHFRACLTLGAAFCCILGCNDSGRQTERGSAAPLVGSWRARVQFTSGAFSSIRDLEFMYVFNDGGTMTESSNYDALPPVPPAYGVWRLIADRTFVAHYEFYITRPPDSTDHVPANFGWLPGGRGALTDTITLAGDNQSFTSRIHLELFDQTGKPVQGGGEATAQGSGIHF